MRASRLLSILFLFHQKRRIKASELAKKYEVSVRTIYRDIDELSAAGVPIYGDSGPGGGFELLDTYKVKPIGFFDSEVKAFFPIFLTNVFDALGIGQNANSAYNKLFANLPDHQKTIAQELNGKILFDPNPWYQNIETPKFLKDIAKVLFENSEIEIEYVSWKKTSKIQIIPIGLVLKSADWYLIGRNDKTLIFKIENILGLEITNIKHTMNNKFCIEDFWQNSIQSFEKQLRPHNVKLAIDDIALKSIEKLGSFAKKSCEEKIYDSHSNQYIINLPYENDVQIIHLLLSIEGDIRIIKPIDLKKKLNEKIHKLQKLNKI